MEELLPSLLPDSDDPKRKVHEVTAKKLQDFAEDEVEGKIKGAVIRSAVSKKVAFGMRLSRFALKEVQKRLAGLAAKEFSSRLMRVCGRRAIMMLVKKAGIIRGGLMVGAIAIDGPAPIGDALAVIFAAWTAADVVELANILWEGYKLNEEMDTRLNAEPSEVDLLGPESLVLEVKKRKVLEDITDDELVEFLLVQDNVEMRVKREGLGWEHWNIVNGDLGELGFYDEGDNRVAGVTNDDLEKMESAFAQIEADAMRDNRIRPDSGFSSLPKMG